MKANKKISTKIANHEGGQAYSLTPETELYTRVLTSLISEDKFYEKGGTSDDRIVGLAKKVDNEFLSGLAIYAREQMNLRSVPLVLASVLANKAKGKLVGNTIARVVQRADEITELLAFYAKINGRGLDKLKPISHQIKSGLGKSFNKFDEYQFAKYDRNKTAIKLKDALQLIRPKPISNEQQLIFDKIVKGELKTPDTWETKISTEGQKEDGNKTKAWEDLIREKKLGYMATLRNLRNILQTNVSKEAISLVNNYIRNEKAVLNSKQFPFRFLSAYNIVREIASPYTSSVLDALEDAVLVSANNLPKLSGTTVIASDTSGSMTGQLSKYSTIKYYHVGLMLSGLANVFCEHPVSVTFDTTCEPNNFSKRAILAGVNNARANGGGTYGHKVFEYLVKNNIKSDRVFFFTDMQLYDNKWDSDSNEFKKCLNDYRKISPDTKIYEFDLSGYGQAKLPENDPNTLLIAGWSDKVFDLIGEVEAGRQGDIIKKIRAIGEAMK